MKIVNRGVIVISYKQAFLDWLNNLPDPFDVSDFDEISTYLIPEYDDDCEAEEFLKRNFKKIFLAEMEAWWTEENDWETELSWDKFLNWFHIEYSAVAFDMGEGNIRQEE